ncbi:MAG TPA: pyrimidine reductase family protein [Jatrophihabitans sp.]|nr:pyrimidine reductase family protein [Jatrophihabitans sp.]
MRALIPQAVDDVDLHAHYAADWLEPGGLRMNFVASADGSAQADGKSAGLQTPGDNAVFAALRDLADVVLVGAGTAVVEGYRPVPISERRAAVRRDFGLSGALPVAVTSRTLRLDPTMQLFTGAADNARTIVLTCAAAPVERIEALRAVADVVLCGENAVEPALAQAALVDRGYPRILSEGGPTLFGEFAGAGVVDELCLSVTPLLAGPGPMRVMAGPAWAATRPLQLNGLLEEDGALFVRYRVR